MIALTLAQILSFYLIRNVKSFWLLFSLAYCVGGVANHALMLAIHEISHGMGFGTAHPTANKLFAIFANLPIGVPMSISFKKYHLEHHRYQGDELLDTDIPTHMEAAFFTNPLRKCIWCFLQPFFYTLRPLFVHPKPLERLELVNIIVQIIFDLIIVRAFGWHILAYMVCGSILAMGLHPVAGHFISEHTLMFEDSKVASDDAINGPIGDRESINNLNPSTSTTKGENGIQAKFNGHQGSGSNGHQSTSEKLGMTINEKGKFLIPETCSYYGPLNWVTFNVGYHVEHHDFPSIPGSRLHMLSQIAPEFYSTLNHHTSWTYVLWQYITDPRVGPSARVRRPHSLRKDKMF